LDVNWQNVRDSLQPDEAAIEFVSFRIYDKGWTDTIQYAALVLRPGMEAPVWVPISLNEESMLAADMIEFGHAQALVRHLYVIHGETLYNSIWKPLEKVLEGVKTIYYSPSGLLHNVAFNAVPAGENKRLMDIYDFNLVSTTREIVSLKTKTAQAPRSAIIYGGLSYEYITENYWVYMEGTNTESQRIFQLLNTNRIPAILYNGNRGNKESFINLDGRGTGIIHLATHNFFHDDIERILEVQTFENPLMKSGLVFSDDIIFSYDIAQMNLLGTELVVLSACSSARGIVNNSEGVFGLPRAFKLAGAQTLLMSLWEVDDEATSILIIAFYENWLSGMSKQEAFRAAQRWLRSTLRFASPFYWAAFVSMD